MPPETTLRIRQQAPVSGQYPIRLTLQRPGRPDLEAEAVLEFALTAQEQADLRWYLEDYLQRAPTVEPVQVEQIEQMMQARGEELYSKVLAGRQGKGGGGVGQTRLVKVERKADGTDAGAVALKRQRHANRIAGLHGQAGGEGQGGGGLKVGHRPSGLRVATAEDEQAEQAGDEQGMKERRGVTHEVSSFCKCGHPRESGGRRKL